MGKKLFTKRSAVRIHRPFSRVTSRSREYEGKYLTVTRFLAGFRYINFDGGHQHSGHDHDGEKTPRESARKLRRKGAVFGSSRMCVFRDFFSWIDSADRKSSSAGIFHRDFSIKFLSC